jgi:transcriptional regulator with XRE-family HTH domain
MLATKTVAEIRRLLAERTHSQREIARLTGVSRGSVGAVALGRRRDGDERLAARDEVIEPLGPPVRCPGCGGLVYLPCVLCRARSYRPKAPHVAQRRGAKPLAESLSLNLRPEHHARYEEVRIWRRESEAIVGGQG